MRSCRNVCSGRLLLIVAKTRPLLYEAFRVPPVVGWQKPAPIFHALRKEREKELIHSGSSVPSLE